MVFKPEESSSSFIADHGLLHTLNKTRKLSDPTIPGRTPVVVIGKLGGFFRKVCMPPA